MIFTDRTITVQKGTSSINDTIVLYRGDKEVDIRFTLNESSPFMFGSGSKPNIIEKTEAAYGQLIIKRPNDLPAIFSEIAPTNGGKIVFTITAEMIDEITEVGNYTFQIRLLDESRNSRATLPEVVNGIEIREPIATEDVSTTNEVNVATVGYAITTSSAPENAFDTQGNYNKTTWQTGDRITAAKLNKMEAGIDGVNNKIAEAQLGVTSISGLTIIDNVIYLKDNEGNIFGTGVEITGTNAGSSQQDTTFGDILSSTLEWDILGDSITYGYGVNDGEQYHQILKSKYNITVVNNYGINSSEIASGGSGGNPMCVRYADMSSTADLITVFGGVNDYLHNIPIGTIDDVETTTFYGALNVLTQGLKNKFQDKKIIFFTPMYCKHGVFSTKPDGTNSLGNKLSDYVTAIKLVCNKENIKIIDLYSIDRYNANTRYSKYFSDGLHPNKQGHADFADKISTAVPSNVTSTINLKSISLEQNTFDLQVGDSCQLNAILKPINATNKTVIFTADNDNVIVNSNGLVTTSNAGNSIITIASEDGEVQATCTININEVVKTFLYNNGDQCESTTGGYTTSMITFNTSDFKIAHNAAGKIETVNTFTMNKGDKVVVKIIGCTAANSSYELRIFTGSTQNVSKNIGNLQTEIEANGYSLIIYEYTSEQTGTLSIGNYFGNYTISEWYIIRA